MKYWIIVMNDLSWFKTCICENKCFSMYSDFSDKKSNRLERIKKGDRILFYLGGKYNKRFLGSGLLKRELSDNPGRDCGNDCEKALSFEKVENWKGVRYLDDSLINELKFIKDKSSKGWFKSIWGKSPILISKYDFDVIHKRPIEGSSIQCFKDEYFMEGFIAFNWEKLFKDISLQDKQRFLKGKKGKRLDLLGYNKKTKSYTVIELKTSIKSISSVVVQIREYMNRLKKDGKKVEKGIIISLENEDSRSIKKYKGLELRTLSVSPKLVCRND